VEISPAQILIVDDEPDNVRIYCDALRYAGYAVLAACDGGAALALAYDSSPDVILLDVVLPGASGLEWLPRFKAQYPETPVIMLTVLDEAAPADQAARDGAFAYLVKPVPLDKFLGGVSQACTARQTRAQRCFGNLRLDLRAQQAFLDENPLNLTLTERRLLTCLAHCPEGATYADLWQAAWDHATSPDLSLIQRTLSNLRRKIGAEHLRTLHKRGYRLA